MCLLVVLTIERKPSLECKFKVYSSQQMLMTFFFSFFLVLCLFWTFRMPLVSVFTLSSFGFLTHKEVIKCFFCISFLMRHRKASYSMITREMHMVLPSCCCL